MKLILYKPFTLRRLTRQNNILDFRWCKVVCTDNWTHKSSEIDYTLLVSRLPGNHHLFYVIIHTCIKILSSRLGDTPLWRSQVWILNKQHNSSKLEDHFTCGGDSAPTGTTTCRTYDCRARPSVRLPQRSPWATRK